MKIYKIVTALISLVYGCFIGFTMYQEFPIVIKSIVVFLQICIFLINLIALQDLKKKKQ